MILMKEIEKIAVAFATLSGNTLTVAQMIKDKIEELGKEAELFDLMTITPDDLKEYQNIFFGSSTYGDGELNMIAEMFFAQTQAQGDSLSYEDNTFRIFALGDSSYPIFCNAGDLIKEELIKHKAKFKGEILKLDGFPDENMKVLVNNWVEANI